MSIQESRTANDNVAALGDRAALAERLLKWAKTDYALLTDDYKGLILDMADLREQLVAAKTDGKQLAKWLAETDTRAKKAGQQLFEAKVDANHQRQLLAEARAMIDTESNARFVAEQKLTEAQGQIACLEEFIELEWGSKSGVVA